MKCNYQIYKWILTLLASIYSCQIYAEVHPVLFKDDASLYSNVYFGMGFEEFKSKIGSNIFECKDSTNKKMADIGCKVSFRFGGSGVSEAVVIFKDNALLAVLGRINTNFYASVISNLNATYKDQPQTENRDEKKGLFSNKISNEYSIWSYPNYLMIVSKYDIQKYVENGTNFLLAVETINENFINAMQAESQKKSNINIQSKVPNIDVAKLHLLNNETQTNTGDRKTQPVVATNDSAAIQKNTNSVNAPPIIQSTGQNLDQLSTTTNKSFLSADLSFGAKKAQIKDKVAFCSTDDKFILGFQKSFPKFGVDEYCIGSNLMTDIQSDTLFLLKDGSVTSVIHRAGVVDFRKLINLYTITFKKEPKNKQIYKATKAIECISEADLIDYVEFCKQQGSKYQYYLSTDSSFDVSNTALNRLKLITLLNTNLAATQVDGSYPIITPAVGNKQEEAQAPEPEVRPTSTDKVKVEYDNFKKLTNFKGQSLINSGSEMFLRGWKLDGKKDTTYQIYVVSSYGGDWRFYNSAYDSDGNRLDFTSISRDVDCSKYGCTHYEHLGLSVTKQYLNKNKSLGINFKVSGKAGEATFLMPGSYIEDFLSVAK